MQLVAFLQELLRFRLAVIAAAALALVLATSMSYRIYFPTRIESRQYQVGVASARALLDTPNSQVVNASSDSTGIDIATLAGRASLLASLMTSAPIKDLIAARAGTPRGTLVTPTPAGVASSPAGDASDSSLKQADPRASLLSASVPSAESGLPMIVVETQAPDPDSAARLADAAIAELKAHLASVAATERLPAARRLVVSQLGPARSAWASKGPSRLMAFAAGFFVFALEIGGILGLSWLMRNWNQPGPAPRVPEVPHLGPEPMVHEVRRRTTARRGQ
jgi:hypothetical protein